MSDFTARGAGTALQENDTLQVSVSRQKRGGTGCGVFFTHFGYVQWGWFIFGHFLSMNTVVF